MVRGRVELPTFRFSGRATLQATLPPTGLSVAEVLASHGPDADQAGSITAPWTLPPPPGQSALTATGTSRVHDSGQPLKVR